MGTDIHQINILERKNGTKVEIENPNGYAKYFLPNVAVDGFDEIEELLPWRWYDMFNIIGGVRGDSFKISSKNGANFEIPSALKKLTEDGAKELLTDGHSFVWYYLKDLDKALLNTADKIGLAAEIESLIDCKEMSEEYRTLRESVLDLRRKTEKALKGKATPTDIVFFFFDS